MQSYLETLNSSHLILLYSVFPSDSREDFTGSSQEMKTVELFPSLSWLAAAHLTVQYEVTEHREF